MLASTLRLGTTAALALMLLPLAGGGPAFAQRNIGSAIAVERDVSAALAGSVRTLGVGNGVFANERIQTANQSAAQLQFLDQARLRIGSATVVLDRFVYNPDRTTRESTVQVTTGAVRWIGGVSQPGTHRVRTPHAIIGVRGTVFDVIVELRRTVVTLREGVIVVCPIAAPRNCLTLDRPGQTVIVTTTTIAGPLPESASPTRFADLCLAPIDRASCGYTTTAQLGPEPTWDGFRAGIHGGYVGSRAPVVVSGSAAIEASIAAGNVPRFLDPSGTGFIGGIQASYSRQFDNIVLGVDADISGLAARGRDNVTVAWEVISGRGLSFQQCRARRESRSDDSRLPRQLQQLAPVHGDIRRSGATAFAWASLKRALSTSSDSTRARSSRSSANTSSTMSWPLSSVWSQPLACSRLEQQRFTWDLKPRAVASGACVPIGRLQPALVQPGALPHIRRLGGLERADADLRSNLPSKIVAIGILMQRCNVNVVAPTAVQSPLPRASTPMSVVHVPTSVPVPVYDPLTVRSSADAGPTVKPPTSARAAVVPTVSGVTNRTR